MALGRPEHRNALHPDPIVANDHPLVQAAGVVGAGHVSPWLVPADLSIAGRRLLRRRNSPS